MNYSVWPTVLLLHQGITAHARRALLLRLVCSLLLIQGLTTAYSRNPPFVVSLLTIPADGVLLNKGWRFRSGDNPHGASPQLNDRQWASLDPTKDIRDLPQLQRSGVGWLRLHLTTGPNLPPAMVQVFQSVASEIYLDGQLLYRFGTVSMDPDRVQAYNPNAAFNLPLQPASEHVLAIRFACQSGLDYNQKHLRWDAAAVQFWLSPATVLPAVRPLSIQSVYLDTFRIGISFILFILHLSLFLAYRTQRANLYAAGMYLLLSVAFWARATNNFAHSMDGRMILHYASMLDSWVPGMATLTFYTLFNFRIGWLFWLAIGSLVVQFVPLPVDYQWLRVLFSYYLQFELIRLSVVATRRRLLGARIVTVGAFFNLGLWITFSALSALKIPVGGNEWLYHTLFILSFLCFPLTLSLRLALEHGWINRQLMARLLDVENLSARNLAHQQERQQLMARQNEELELQVMGRTQELRQQADQLRELAQVKSRFVTNITHEFRTPLSLIMAPVEKLLRESRFDRPALTLVQRNAGQLLELINQLMDLSKLEGNYMAVSFIQGNVTDFIHHTVAAFRQSAEQKGVTLACAVLDLPPKEYLFDADKWAKILINLLANAFKFTETGGQVRLTGMPVWVGGEMSALDIRLVDSGIGIAPDALPHIFDRFYQADASSTRTYEGTGIGLALVHELISLLGGTITVESQLTVGTTFRLRLPVRSVSSTVGEVPKLSWLEPEQAAITQPASVADRLSNPLSVEDVSLSTILIIDDNDELREFLKAQLASSYQVFQAVDGEAGWAIIQTELPDIVLTDVMMPRLDGLELTRLIKGHIDTDHIAVVMLTAKTALTSRIDGLQQGADDYLLKPFSLDELQLRLRNLTSRQQKLGEHYRQQFALPGSVGAPIDSLTEIGSAKRAFPDNPLTFMPALSIDPFLVRIYRLLDLHLDDSSIGVDWLADQLAMNRKTLYRKVQSLIQLAPADLIRQYRLRKAAELLRAGYNVTETAYRVGFNTPSHFTIVFREIYRQTPTEFIASRRKGS